MNSRCLTVLNHRAENWIKSVYPSLMLEAVTQDLVIFREAGRQLQNSLKEILLKNNGNKSLLCVKHKDKNGNLLYRIFLLVSSDKDPICNKVNLTSTVW